MDPLGLVASRLLFCRELVPLAKSLVNSGSLRVIGFSNWLVVLSVAGGVLSDCSPVPADAMGPKSIMACPDGMVSAACRTCDKGVVKNSFEWGRAGDTLLL